MINNAQDRISHVIHPNVNLRVGPTDIGITFWSNLIYDKSVHFQQVSLTDHHAIPPSLTQKFSKIGTFGKSKNKEIEILFSSLNRIPIWQQRRK